MRLAAGTRFGAYEIRSALGAGGMGEVYRARDTTLGRDVAIKVLLAAVAGDAERLARFEREARVLASLNHPGIAAIYGVERASLDGTAADVPGLVLELVEGETLADRIRRGPIPPLDALRLARQIADALDFAHDRGVVHRDLKPANIKITPDDAVKLLDFGLAKALTGEASRDADAELSHSPTALPSGTGAGVILGTAAYMSPEQARGRPVDKRTDIWAFGCVLYEMLTGARAFAADSLSDTIAAVLVREPDLAHLPASTPPRIGVLLRRCFEKDPGRRLRDIADARAEIDEALAPTGGADVEPLPADGQAVHTASRRFWGVLAIGAAAAACAGWVIGRQGAKPRPPAFDRMIRIVATAADEFAPVISPDGKWIAYLSNARGPTDVWVKFIAGGDPANLTASTDLTVQARDYIGGLAVSPDGSQLAFQATAPRQRGASWVIPAPLGGVPRRALAVGSSGLQWSPDGRRIAYVKTGGSRGDSLMLADASGQNEVEAVRREGARHTHWLRWGADGKFVYFNRSFQNFNIEPTEIFRVPAAGGPIEPVVTTPRRAVFPFPSPDGRGLFYAANPDSADLSLWWKDLASGRDYRLTAGVGEYSVPSVSADGRRMVGTVVEVRQSLDRVAVDFDRPVALEPLTDGFSGDANPSWSPDGSRMVFSSSRTGQRTLWTARADLTRPAPLTSGEVFDERPVYSPDGQQVAFVSDRGGRQGIWVVGADAGTPRLVIATDVVDNLCWSPDGRRILFATPIGDEPGLMTVDVNSGRTAQVPTPAAAAMPAWSPRDDLIVYVEPRGGDIGAPLKMIREDGRLVLDTWTLPDRVSFANGMTAWSPDGRRIAAASLPGSASGSIWILEVEGTPRLRRLLEVPASVFLQGVTWSRDGSSLVVGNVRRASDIFLAERSAGQ